MYNKLWNEFEKSGSVQSYLEYRMSIDNSENTEKLNKTADGKDAKQK